MARFTAAVGLALGVADGLGDGVLLPDAVALGVGSTVGPGDDTPGDGGRPTVGVVPTSSTRGVGAPCTPTAAGFEAVTDGDADADGAGAAGPVVVDTTGGAPAEEGSAGTTVEATTASDRPAAATEYR